MKNNPLPRLDSDSTIREQLLPYCRLRPGEIWQDSKRGHRVGCIDAADEREVKSLTGQSVGSLALHDPPYNLVAFDLRSLEEYVKWCKRWVSLTYDALSEDASLYVWLGADQTAGFQPFADFAIMMRDLRFKSRSLITMRNQRGYGTQQNWMAVRQELLYYTKGRPLFNIEAEYTDIPKILRGYYKEVKGRITENLDRSKSDTIRAGNVWVDIQQVFYRMDENVSGCYAQKPMKAVERIVKASSQPGDIVLDFFAHSGSTLLAAERLDRICLTADNDPLFCEISIRRLEHFRESGRLGWQNGHPFEKELPNLISQEPGEPPLIPRSDQVSFF